MCIIDRARMLAAITISIDLMRKLRRYWVVFWGAIFSLLLLATPLPASQNLLDRSPQPCGNLQSTNISLNCSIDELGLIRSIAFSPDRQLIATGGAGDQSVKLWRVSDGRLLRTFDAARTGLIGSVEFIGTPTASYLLVNNDDGDNGRLYQIWRSDNGRLVWEIDEKKVGSVLPSADRKSIVTVTMKANKQTIISTRDIFTGKITKTVRSKLKNHFQPLQLADRDTLLLGTTNKNELQAWRIADGKLMWTIGDIKNTKADLLIKDDRLAILSLDRQKISVYKVNNGKLLWSASIERKIAPNPSEYGEENYQMMSSPDAQSLVIFTFHPLGTSANSDRLLTVRSWADGRKLWQQEFDGSVSSKIGISDRSISIVTAENTMKIFDLNSGRVRWVYQAESDPSGYRSLSGTEAISPDRQVQVIDAGNDPEVWELDKPKKLMTIDYNGTITFSPDSQLVAALKNPYYRNFWVWNVAQNRKLSCMLDEQDTVEELFFTPDDRTVITAYQGGDINFWRMFDRQLVKTIHTQHGVLTKMVVTADGKTAITNGEDDRLRVWRLADGKLLWSADAEGIEIVTFSPDNRVVSAAGWTRGVCMRSPTKYYSWRMQDGVKVPLTKADLEKIELINNPKNSDSEDSSKQQCKTLAVTSNKQTLVCERQNHYEIQIRRASNGKKLGRIYTGNYNQFVAVTRDDRWIITRDSGIDIWNLKNGKLHKSIKVAPKQINEAKISANGRYLIVTYRATTLDESIEIWPISKLI